MSATDRLHALADDLRRQRDELELKLHLASADARDEWAALEKKLEHLEGKLKVLGREASEVAHDVGSALETVGRELKAGYERLRKLV